jgi:hypothetical protein
MDFSASLISALRDLFYLLIFQNDRNAIALVSNMMSMLKLMSPAHFAAYIHQLEPGTEAGRQNLLDFVMEVLLMFKDLIQHRWAGIHRDISKSPYGIIHN